ncbi:hypothetical protein LS71_005905 [Helicobacter jaachi]|uniref:Disulfide isomerase DsbG N-terminal domain-containing protein n=1 Tax=Helicobacter jaachi TaxID=1677920 RepID=A0A4U8T9V0_9HELI|nr:hypothetical protein [Helicobacter jaachi]TLD96591.1 hypothetical protein LS71_005905 [Helicobacter jaachi]
MRSVVLLLALLCALCASDVQELQKTLKANDIIGKVISSTSLGNGLDMVVIEAQNQEVPFFATSDGKVIFQPQVLFFQDKNTESKAQGFYAKVQEKQKAKTDIKLLEVFKSQSGKVFHFKAKKPSSKTLYIVADANCPYCREEFKKLEAHLEKANVEMVLVGFLGEDSMLKAANALKNKSGNQAKDIAMLSQLYQADIKGKPMDTQGAATLTQAVANTGVHSVPYIIER